MGDQYLRDLKSPSSVGVSSRVLASIIALANFLVLEARTLEHGSESKKKEAKDQVPTDKIKDPSALARELRWRARLAGGFLSDEEYSDQPSSRRAREYHRPSTKRKRTGTRSSSRDDSVSRFRNFRPRTWDKVTETPTEKEIHSIRVKKPEITDWTTEWIDDMDVGVSNGDEGSLSRHREVVVKVRKTVKGIERQRIERVVEKWVWDQEHEHNGDSHVET